MSSNIYQSYYNKRTRETIQSHIPGEPVTHYRFFIFNLHDYSPGRISQDPDENSVFFCITHKLDTE